MPKFRKQKNWADTNLFHYIVLSDSISVEGLIRVISDEFSISLLNPESEAYRFKEQKYSKMVSLSLNMMVNDELLQLMNAYNFLIADQRHLQEERPQGVLCQDGN